jgi:hypothetical protein
MMSAVVKIWCAQAAKWPLWFVKTPRPVRAFLRVVINPMIQDSLLLQMLLQGTARPTFGR